ncbi:phosphotransferase family enzyme [Ureibacillus xyleni]|uniref:Phosphotransferase family enzyme n=1 Tax=Ureibacillus xyleni TaxID=614648 RepID=A0A285SGB4_9BACL|nr:aminoglycoside phosphotransferase family protein [Ureibacillus xyleni]SOC06420.1 phosphotransferase family enzyme [Ureibacillus xyleni]
MNEQSITEHLKKYGDIELLRLTGGYTNQTYLLKGTNPPKVVKVANTVNKDIVNEMNCMKITQHTGIVPKLYDFFEHKDHQFVVLEFREGINGQSILDNHDLERAKVLFTCLGEALSTKIHSIKYHSISYDVKKWNLHELNFDLDFVPAELQQKSKMLVNAINDQKEDWVLTHGDYGVHNVLFTDHNSLTVLDWEWAEWANPLTDVGWVCWFTKLHYPEYANLLSSLFISAYEKNNPIEHEKLKPYCVYKVWTILNKVRSSSIEVQQEWVRRLKWTIEIF